MRLLVVEDDKRVARALKRGLEGEGFAVDVAFTGEDGRWLAGENAYDALVLDVMLPGIGGLELCAALRDGDNWTPILMLTAKDAPDDEAQALDGGADDFLSKPFSYTVLVARLRALLRRGGGARPIELVVGDLRLDPAAHQVWRGATEVSLTPRQFSLLEFFMRRPGRCCPSPRSSSTCGTSPSTATRTSSRSTCANCAKGSTSRSSAQHCRPCGLPAIDWM